MLSLASGAKNTAAFGNALNSGEVPHESSIEYEGVYAKYQFETGEEKEKDFAPVFTAAHTKDPLSGKMETYVCVGMNGCLDGDGLKRHGGRSPLNLVLVVDKSGSMSQPFSTEAPRPVGPPSSSHSKMSVATEAIITGLLPQLTPNDRLSIIAFNTEARVIQPMKDVSDIDVAALKTEIKKLGANGGTKLRAGIDAASEQIKSLPDWDAKGRDNRIFYMTDMCPNETDTDGAYLFTTVAQLSRQRVYTTFVGIGVDFNTALTKRIAKIRACNYLGVSSAADFMKMMNEQFDYLTTIACLDVQIAIKGDYVNVARVFGSPGFHTPKDGVLCEMSSCFPSLKESPTLTQGGVVLVKLAEPLPTRPLEFVVTYVGRKGNNHRDTYTFTLPPADTEVFQGSAVRKAVLLTRHAAFMKNYLLDAARNPAMTSPSISTSTGITVPPAVSSLTTRHSRRGGLDEAYKTLFKTFIAHYESEAEALGDKSLREELKALQDVLGKSA